MLTDIHKQMEGRESGCQGGMETPPDGGLDAGNGTAGEDGSCSGRAGDRTLYQRTSELSKAECSELLEFVTAWAVDQGVIDGDEIWGMKQSATCSVADWANDCRVRGLRSAFLPSASHPRGSRFLAGSHPDFWWFPSATSATRVRTVSTERGTGGKTANARRPRHWRRR